MTSLKAMKRKSKRGLTALKIKPPISAVNWTNKYFKLPAGSSQVEGQWTTLPYQVAPLNMMTNDAINEYYEQKSARIGYTKRLVAAFLYLAEHKKRSAVIYQPTDDDAKSFVVSEVDSTIAEMPVIKAIFPDHNAKNENNTLKKKVLRGVILDFRGAKSPKNFRAITKQVVVGDEIDGWDFEVGKEGNPIKLAITRLVGATFPKAIFGTTPTNKGESHIERLMASAYARFRLYLPCPHCDQEQHLEWGGKDYEYGMKWDDSLEKEDIPYSAYYQCKHCQKAIKYKQLRTMHLKGRWIDDIKGIWTLDGEHFFNVAGNKVLAPRKCGTYINALYSLTMTEGWPELVREWLDVKGDPLKLKTFINLVLGELWEEDASTKIDAEGLYKHRREMYHAQVPDDVLILVGGIDTQDDRVEFVVWGIGANEEMWLIHTYRLYGDLAQPATKAQVPSQLHKTFTRSDGSKMSVALWCWDSAGHKTDEVYQMSRLHGVQWVIPIKGASTFGKPIATWPRKKTAKKVYLTIIGTENAKDLIYNRLTLTRSKPDEPQAGAIHFPLDDSICDEEFFKQLCSNTRKVEHKDGRRVVRYVAHAKEEIIDCTVYAMGALRIMQQHFSLDLELLALERVGKAPEKIDMKALGEKLGRSK